MNERKETSHKIFIVVAVAIPIMVCCLAIGGFAWLAFEFPQFGSINPHEVLVWQHYVGNAVMSAPQVKDSMVFFGSLDDISSPTFYALDATTGVELWVKPLSDGVEWSPIVTDQLVYFSTVDGYFYCLEKDTGQERWVFTPEQQEMETGDKCNQCGLKYSAPVIKDGVLYVGSLDNNLYAINAETGQLQWYFPTQGSILDTPTIVDDYVYVGSLDGSIYVVDRDSGAEVKRLLVPSDIRLEAMGVTGVFAIALIEDDTVYAINGRLLAIDVQTGETKWKYGSLLPQNLITETGGTLEESIVVVTEGSVIAVNKSTGEKEWEFSKIKGSIYGRPTLYSGYLYFGDSSGHLYVVHIDSGRLEKRYDMSKLGIHNQYMFVSDFVFPPAVETGMLYVSSYGYLSALQIED